MIDVEQTIDDLAVNIIVRTGILKTILFQDVPKSPIMMIVILRVLDGRVNSKVRYLEIERLSLIMNLDEPDRLFGEKIRYVLVGKAVSWSIAAMHIVPSHVLIYVKNS